ncbi:MAG TPA: RHS repeat-associated core domain-containing protein [Bryobacteraceae bacterium]|nr:RHS repeat-associated core domain-containing protein [Bryobacteraceae bacterium]
MNSAINVVERYDYAPFGEELTAGIDGRISTSPQFYSTNQYPTVTPDSTTDKFTSKERDAETGLDFFGARYFSSAQGRFTSPDWSAKPQPVPYATLNDPQTLNLYAYVRNSPLSINDPDGHEILCYGCGAGGQDVPAGDHKTTPISGAEKQVETGILELGAALATGGASEELAAGGHLLKAAVGAIASGGLVASGVIRIIATVSGNEPEKTEQAATSIGAVTTPVGLVTTAVTGSTSLGATASDAKGVVSVVQKPSEAAKDPGGTVVTVGNFIQDIKNLLKPPPPPAPPQPPPPPKCPTCQ